MSALKVDGGRVLGRIVLLQIAIAVTVALAFWGFSGLLAAYSALMGGGISAVASLFMGRRVLSPSGNVQPQRLLRRFFVGELLKISLTAAMFVVAVVLLRAKALPLLSGYGATVLAYWFALLSSESVEQS